MSDKNNTGEVGFENLIALANMRTKKKNSKDGRIQDLFKCVESISGGTESLRDYVGTVSDPAYRDSIAKYLGALSKIQDGLLEIAQAKLRGLSEMPDFIDPEASEEEGKIGKI